MAGRPHNVECAQPGEQSQHWVMQFVQRARVILRTEGVAGLGKRIAGRLKRKPRHVRFYILMLRLDRPVRVPPPTVEIEIEEVKITDEDTLAALAQVDEWKTPEAHLRDRLQSGQRCYVARYQGQIVAGRWFLEGEFDSSLLGRWFQMATNEIYGYNTFTIPAFRGKGINPYLTAESVRRMCAHNPHKTLLVVLISVTNRASLRSAAKVGFKRVGLAGFVEVFGVRFHYLLGRGVLPATRKRFYVERM